MKRQRTLFETCGTEKIPRTTGNDAAIMIDSDISSTGIDGSTGTAESHVQELNDSESTSGK